MLYKEPKDGMIALRKGGKNLKERNKSYSCSESLPDIELVTLIDVSTLWEDK